MRRNRSFSIQSMACVVLFVFALTLPAVSPAALIVFTDRSAWETAVGAGNFQTEDFNSTPLINPIPNNTVHDVGLFDVFYTTDTAIDETGNQIVEPGDIDGSRVLRLQFDTIGTDQTTLLQLQSGLAFIAFGADWNRVNDGEDLALTVNNVAGDSLDVDDNLGTAPVSFTDPNNDGGFLGFTSDTSFTTITLAANPPAGAETFSLDNVVLGSSGSSSPVPEPNTLVLFGIAVLSVLGYGYRRKKKAAI